MAEAPAGRTVLQFRIHLLGITPMIWRGLHLRADHTLADLHNVIQIAFDWTDYSLHQFERRGRSYCAPRAYGLDGEDASSVKLSDLRLRVSVSLTPTTTSPSGVTKSALNGSHQPRRARRIHIVAVARDGLRRKT